MYQLLHHKHPQGPAEKGPIAGVCPPPPTWGPLAGLRLSRVPHAATRGRLGNLSAHSPRCSESSSAAPALLTVTAESSPWSTRAYSIGAPCSRCPCLSPHTPGPQAWCLMLSSVPMHKKAVTCLTTNTCVGRVSFRCEFQMLSAVSSM